MTANAKAGLRPQVLRHQPTDACAAGLEITWRGGPDYNNIRPDGQHRRAQRRLLGRAVEQLGWGLRQELARGFSPRGALPAHHKKLDVGVDEVAALDHVDTLRDEHRLAVVEAQRALTLLPTRSQLVAESGDTWAEVSR